MFNLSIADILLSLPGVLIAISIHEFGHAWTAWKLGDPTAKLSGRMTINPLAHFDPIGAIMLLLFRFGWAKPVPVDPRYFKNPQRDMFLVSIAGPGANLLTAFVFSIPFHFFPSLMFSNWALTNVFVSVIVINLALMVFNLIPIPPLDGSKILYALLPSRYLGYFDYLERYGFIILLFLIMTNATSAIMTPVIRFFMSVLL